MTGVIWWDILVILGIVSTSLILLVLIINSVSRAKSRKEMENKRLMSHLARELRKKDHQQ